MNQEVKKVDSGDLSIIVTTSPIRSHPDTQIIDDSISSILQQSTLAKVHVYIVCDGAKVKQENEYKSGIITQETMDNYNKYKQILRQKYNDKNKFTIVQRETRCGFAENIRYIMEQYTKTDYVLIYQHDHVIQREIDFYIVIQTMRRSKEEINYITFMHSNYKNIFPKLINILPLKTYLLNLLNKDQSYNLDASLKQFREELLEYFKTKFGLSLMPLNFWYDKVHVASRQYYLDVIFNKEGNFDPNRQKHMKTVSFVEDTFGHCMKNTISIQPEKLLEYGAYILWDEKPIFYHQSGRAFIVQEEKQQYLKKKKNKKQSQPSLESESEEDFPLNFDIILND